MGGALVQVATRLAFMSVCLAVLTNSQSGLEGFEAPPLIPPVLEFGHDSGVNGYDDYFYGVEEAFPEDLPGVDLAKGIPDVSHTISSECMPPIINDLANETDFETRRSARQQRRPLMLKELESKKAKAAVVRAVEYYIQSRHGSSHLEMTSIESGCRQTYAGELLFLIFNAKETIFCDTTIINATCTENTMHAVECRARVHLSVPRGSYPFYTSCHPKEFFDIERTKVKIAHVA